jgi:gamma-glutamyltranspeptidase/glutathione hydrolase
MNNGIMWFDPRPGHPNGMAPGKRPLTNMCPLIAEGAEGEVFAGGASGGRRILAAVTQTALFVLDFGMSVEEAAHGPRIDVSGPDRIFADARLAPDVIAALRAEGPSTVVEHGVFPINFACPNFLVLRPDGTREGMSDARSPWSAALAETGSGG